MLVRCVFFFALWISPALALADSNPVRELHPLTITSKSHTTTIDVEFATTQEEQMQGLMHRPYLPEYRGMLFIFDDYHLFSVWMKNTLVSLDVYFINKEREITHILRNMKPLSEEIHHAGLYSKYMLEVPGGFSRRHGIRIGDKLEW